VIRALFLIILGSIWTGWASAAPLPGVATALTQKSGSFYSSRGFRLDSGSTAWVQTEPPKHIPSLVAIYQAPLPVEGQQPALTVRVDKLARPLSLKGYVKKWMQDYTRFGFDVLTAKPIQIGTNSAFLLDILSRETQKQLRQVVFLRERTAVTLTCRDSKSSFESTVKDCNQIIKTFSWTP